MKKWCAVKFLQPYRWFVLLGGVAFIVMCLFPPFKHPNGDFSRYSFFVHYYHPGQVDFGRLALQWLMLALTVVLAAWASTAFDWSAWKEKPPQKLSDSARFTVDGKGEVHDR